MLLQMPIWIAIVSLFSSFYHFQAGVIFVGTDLSSFDAFIRLPFWDTIHGFSLKFIHHFMGSVNTCLYLLQYQRCGYVGQSCNEICPIFYASDVLGFSIVMPVDWLVTCFSATWSTSFRPLLHVNSFLMKKNQEGIDLQKEQAQKERRFSNQIGRSHEAATKIGWRAGKNLKITQLKPAGVIGAGSFGITVANLLAENTDVLLFSQKRTGSPSDQQHPPTVGLCHVS